MKCKGTVWAYIREDRTTVKEYKALLYYRDAYYDGDFWEPGTTYLKLLDKDGKAIKKVRCTNIPRVPCNNTLWFYTKQVLDPLAMFANVEADIIEEEKTKSNSLKVIDILKYMPLTQDVIIYMSTPNSRFSSTVNVALKVLSDDILQSEVYKLRAISTDSSIRIYIEKDREKQE
ncbi:hypothetical protein [[Ruminococcus] lactaris]|uniref:hypothetical protein n=1 Tax=[Ruminococcus] lactaris TaxID=46228 RepID=UPI0039F55C64